MSNLILADEGFSCLNCQGKMIFKERKKDGRNVSGSKHRRRVFECEDCGYTELIHANGERDLNDFNQRQNEST